METLRLQHRTEDPRELADTLRDEEIVLHEPLDGQIAAARPIAHARRDLGLAVEGEAILRAGADDVQVRPHPPEEILRPREATILVPAEHTTLDELAETLDAEEVLGDPEQHVEIAQTALAVLYVGFEEIARIAGPQVAGVAFAKLSGDELGLGAGHQLAEKTPAERIVERLIAPHMARFEHGGPNRHVLLRPSQTIGDRAGRVAHGEAEVPHHVEQMFDDLLASAGQLVGVQEENIDIGVRRQIAPAIAADRHQGEAARRGRIGLGIDDVRPPLEQRAQQLVDQGGLGRNDLGTGGTGFEAPAELPTALVAGASRKLQDGLPVISTEPGDRLRESPSVEKRRRPPVGRTHRCTRGLQPIVGRTPPEREAHAEPDPMAPDLAPNTAHPQAHSGLRGARARADRARARCERIRSARISSCSSH